VTGTGTAGCEVDLTGHTRPSTTNKVLRKTTVGSDGSFALTIYPPADTVLYAQSRGAKASPLRGVNVRFRVSLKVAKTGTRALTFSGNVAPGRSDVPVTVYRSNGSSYVKVGSTTTTSNGTWSLAHTFGGTGSFTFYALGETTADNDSNRSALTKATIS
jgi:hypothetical protein